MIKGLLSTDSHRFTNELYSHPVMLLLLFAGLSVTYITAVVIIAMIIAVIIFTAKGNNYIINGLLL